MLEPFFIEVDIFETGDPVQLFVMPEMVNEGTKSIFKIDYQDTGLAILEMDQNTLSWKAVAGNLDQDSVDAIGAEIDKYYR